MKVLFAKIVVLKIALLKKLAEITVANVYGVYM